jgi:hypothetical protein
MTYTNGTFGVAANRKRDMADGFRCSLHYEDGHGIAVAPHTGEHVQVTNSHTSEHDELGINDDFNATAKLNELLQRNQGVWQRNIGNLVNKHNEYRRGLIDSRNKDEIALDSTFWLAVYNNHRLPRQATVLYMDRVQRNKDFQDFERRHGAGLNYLYGRLKYVLGHPCASLWFVFWDDLWDNNKKMDAVKKLEKELNPKYSDAIGYKPMKRPELEAWLKERKLYHEGNKKFVCAGLLDVLYGRMDRLENEAKQKK